MYEIESRIIKNTKIGEKAEVTVAAQYMQDRNSELLSFYSLSPNQNCVFVCEIHQIDIWDYIRDAKTDTFNKKRVLKEGVGEIPDRDSFVKLKLKVIDNIENKVLFDSFYCEVAKLLVDDAEFEKWNSIVLANFPNREEELEVQEKVFRECEFFGLKECDLRLYTIPVLLRKTLVHMRRGQINELHVNFIDTFDIEGLEMEWAKGNFTIIVQLFEFTNRNLFSNLPYEGKLSDLTDMKTVADTFFKKKKLVRAGKIYQNINYRFNFGDVFGSKSDEEKELAVKNKELYEQLSKIRIGSHLNLASSKFRLNQYKAVVQIADKVISDFDENNQKALYLLGKSKLELKLFEEAVSLLGRLKELNEEFEGDYKDAVERKEREEKKVKGIFKKMVFAEDN